MNVVFRDAGPSLTDEDIADVERSLGLTFPEPLRRYLRKTNGGNPEPCVYTDDRVDTSLCVCLPLLNTASTYTAVSRYQRLVGDGRIERKMFPFAEDWGSNLFVVDCNSPDAQVHFYRADLFPDDDVIALGLNLDEFWSALVPE